MVENCLRNNIFSIEDIIEHYSHSNFLPSKKNVPFDKEHNISILSIKNSQ